MKIAFIADGRSDHARRWISYFASKCEILLISPFECTPLPGVAIVTLPGRFRLSDQLLTGSTQIRKRSTFITWLLNRTLRNNIANQLWALLKLTDLFQQVRATRTALRHFRPDVIHALRVQNEGYLAAFSCPGNYFVSSWGSDFIDTATNSIIHRQFTKLTLKHSKQFMADCKRDVFLATKFNLPQDVPRYVFPGNGGVNSEIFYPPVAFSCTASILYCRGMSRVTRIDTLLDGFKLLQARSNNTAHLTILTPTGTHGEFKELIIDREIDSDTITLRDFVDPVELAQTMREHNVFVSPMMSDGVPNSMLEAMASGMIPVMSDLESVREHVTHGVNGYIFDPNSAESLCAALKQAVETADISFREANIQAIRIHSDYQSCLARVLNIYKDSKNTNVI